MVDTILIIEDQRDINDLVSLNLSMLGHEVVQRHNGAEGFATACANSYALIVLDIMLPDMNGLDLCKALRKKDINTPVLMLTAKKTEMDRVLGLEIGADDYLTKPFSVLELQARVKALLRRVALMHRTPDTSDSDIVVNDLLINRQKREVLVADAQVTLTAKEFDLLAYLASDPGTVFSREQLLSSVWGYQYSGYEHTVNSHINRLRNKIEPNPEQPKYVLTVWGVGYKFNEN